eukprot:1434433-Pleurochrysis_carterae.AAC.1
MESPRSKTPSAKPRTGSKSEAATASMIMSSHAAAIALLIPAAVGGAIAAPYFSAWSESLVDLMMVSTAFVLCGVGVAIEGVAAGLSYFAAPENGFMGSLVVHTLQSLCAAVCIGYATYALILFLGWSGFWDVLEHEDVDPNERVMLWTDVKASDKKKNSDYTGPRLECRVKLPFTEKLFGHLIENQHDLPLLHMMVSATCVLVPLAFMVYASFLYAPFWLACFMGFGVYQYVRVQFFMNGLLHFRHFTSHRPLFKSRWLNVLPNLYLDPLMGIPPLVFLLHHPIMHHMANNGIYDISTTEPYQRDSWLSYANYWLRFQLGAYIELPMYAWNSKRYGWFFGTLATITTFFLAVQYLADTQSGYATFCVFFMPWIYDHATDASRNWCQHLFVVDYDDPAPVETLFDYNCGLAYNLVDSLENRTQYNEGYHVIHHAWGGHHWSQVPDQFYECVDKLATNDNENTMCITFVRSDIWEVWRHVVARKLPKLVKNHYVHIPTRARPSPPTVGEVVTKLEARLNKLDQRWRKGPSEQAKKRKLFQRQKSQNLGPMLG